jgi:phosphoribosylamine--glycine ligase
LRALSTPTHATGTPGGIWAIESSASRPPATDVEDATATGALVFHAGTALRDGRLATAGGRVLAVSALGDSLAEARERAYAGVERIRFDGAQRRTDIALAAAGREAARA